MVNLYLLLLTTAMSCIDSQIVLTQSEQSVVVAPGHSHKLTCACSGFSLSGTSMFWIRQAPGKGLEWIIYYYSDSDKSSAQSVQGRFTASKDSSNFYLHMNQLKTEDTAVYYCARGYYDAFDYWGKGTMVTVSSAQPSAPQSLFGLSQCGSDSDGFLTVGCMARGFSPADSLSFKWTDPTGQQVNDFVQYPAFGQDGDYTKISHMRVKKSDWDPTKPYKCEATNTAGKMETGFIPPAKRVTKPSITLLSKMDGDKTLLECQLNDYYPDKLTVQWLRDEQPVRTSLPEKKLQNADNKQKTFTRINQLAIDAPNLGKLYTCKAIHNSEEFTQNYNVCQALDLSKPLMYINKPHVRDIVKEKEVTISCVVEAPYNTEVTWVANGQSKTGKEIKRDLSSSRTQNILSNLTFSRKEWEKLETVVCTAKHPCFQIQKPAIEAGNTQKDPVVVIRRPFRESVEPGSVVLECVVRDIPLGEVCITFQANGADFSEINCVDVAHYENIWSLATDFTIPSDHHTKDKTFTCTVHSRSKTWTSKRTENIFDNPTVELSLVPGIGESSSIPQKLVCSGTGFDPKIRWFSQSGEKRDAVVDVTLGRNGRSKVYSEISVPQQEWNQGVTITCKVTDNNKSVNKSTSICAVPEHSSQLVDVYLLGPSHSDVRSHSVVSLTCLVVGHRVKDFTIQWKVDGDNSNLHDYLQRPQDHPNGTQSKQSILKVPVMKWNAYSRFSCEVTHFCSGVTQKKHISKTRDPKPPTVRILKPPDSDLSGSQNTSFLCLITGFFPSDISVDWELNGTQLDVSHFINSPVVAHTASGGYSVYSELILPASQWKEGTYSCIVSYESSKNPIIATLDHFYALFAPSAPSAKLLQGSNELVCLAFGFSPSAINITWLLGVTEMFDHTVTSLAKGPDGKFSIRSHLHLLLTEWAPGEVYTCRVTHSTGILLLNISKPEIFEEAIFMNENKAEYIAQDSVEETWRMACAFLILFLFSLFYGCTVTMVKIKS